MSVDSILADLKKPKGLIKACVVLGVGAGKGTEEGDGDHGGEGLNRGSTGGNGEKKVG